MTVRVYKSTDASAPTLSGTVNSLVALLDACLVTGYPTQSITSITRSGATATATKTAHGYTNGQVISISGATQPEYNGNVTVANAAANTFDYTVSGTPATPATGTIVASNGTTGAGWTKPFTGTNKAVFRNSATAGTGFYLNVQDNGPGAGAAREARVWGYEVATAQDTGTGQFPTAAQRASGLFVRKSATADSTARPWVIVADETVFYLFVECGDNVSTTVNFMFGDIFSYKASDTYRCMIIGRTTENSSAFNVDNFSLLAVPSASGNVVNDVPSHAGHYIARVASGVGSSNNNAVHSDHAKHAYGTMGAANAAAKTLPYPNGPDGGLFLAPVYVHGAEGIRGYMKGLWNVCHNRPGSHNDTFTGNTGGLNGKTFILQAINDSVGAATDGRVAVETSNTWS
jgi:hypothetical protein